MEYLKNIIIHFMSADSAGREQMINPIATVLHFSKEEVCLSFPNKINYYLTKATLRGNECVVILIEKSI